MCLQNLLFSSYPVDTSICCVTFCFTVKYKGVCKAVFREKTSRICLCCYCCPPPHLPVFQNIDSKGERWSLSFVRACKVVKDDSDEWPVQNHLLIAKKKSEHTIFMYFYVADTFIQKWSGHLYLQPHGLHSNPLPLRYNQQHRCCYCLVKITILFSQHKKRDTKSRKLYSWLWLSGRGHWCLVTGEEGGSCS